MIPPPRPADAHGANQTLLKPCNLKKYSRKEV